MSGRVGSLFPNFVLSRPTALIPGELVNAQNSAEARYYVDQQSRKWVGKEEVETGFQSVLAEALCWFLAREGGVLVPDAGYVGAIGQDNFIWLSEFVRNPQHWEPRFGNFISNDEQVGAMLALDAVTLNNDRHSQNVLVVAEGSETRLRVWAIDSGNALVGQIDDFCGKSSLAIPEITRTIKGLPISRLRIGAAAAASRFATLANHPTFLASYVDTACDLVLETEKRASLLARLRDRLRNSHVIASEYLDALEAES